MRRTIDLGTSGRVRTTRLLNGFESASGPRSARDARAKHQTVTVRAPAAARRAAHSRAVAPEVATSSTRSTCAGGLPATRKARRTLRRALRSRQAALDLGVADLGEAVARQRQIEARATAPRPARRRGGNRGAGARGGWRARPATSSTRGGGSRAAMDLGQPRREIVRALELEGQEDRARRARVGSGRAEPFEGRRVDQTASADGRRPAPREGLRRNARSGRPPETEETPSTRRTRRRGRSRRPASRGRPGTSTAGRILPRRGRARSLFLPQRFRSRLRKPGSGGIVAFLG